MLFGKTKQTSAPAAPGRTSFGRQQDRVSDYPVPDWVRDWPADLGENIVDDLLALHEKLLTTATNADHNALFLAAAKVIREVTHLHTRWSPDGVDLDLRPETQAAVTDVLDVLRHDTADRAVYEAFETASSWAQHGSLRITAAETEQRQSKTATTTDTEARPATPPYQLAR